MTKRILSLVLALCMMIPMLAIAETEEPAETIELIELEEAAAEDTVTVPAEEENNTENETVYPESMTIICGESAAQDPEYMALGDEMELEAELSPRGSHG